MLIVNSGHRFGETRGVRRRKHHTYAGMASVVHIGQKQARIPPTLTARPYIDHSPHEVNTRAWILILPGRYMWREENPQLGWCRYLKLYIKKSIIMISEVPHV